MKHSIQLKVVLLGIFGVMLGWIVFALFVPRISKNQVQELVDREVPLGTSQREVREWLDSQTFVRYSGVAAGSSGKTAVVGWIPNTGPRWETMQEIEVRFWIEDDVLVHTQVEVRSAPSL